MSVTFAKLGKVDALAIARLQFESWRNSYRDVLPDSYIDGAMEQDLITVWSDWQDEKLVVGAIAGDGTLAGFAAYLMKDPVYLDNFHVDREHHGTGVASGLFIAGAAAIEAAGGALLWLTVLETNARARAFYAKMGGVERPVLDDEMLGYKVKAVPVHWHQLHIAQKMTSEV